MPTSGPLCGSRCSQIVSLDACLSPRVWELSRPARATGKGMDTFLVTQVWPAWRQGDEPMTWPGPLLCSPVCIASPWPGAAESRNFLQKWLCIPRSGDSCTDVYLGPNSWDLCASQRVKTLNF